MTPPFWAQLRGLLCLWMHTQRFPKTRRRAPARAGASFSTEAEKVGENSNKLTIELVNTDSREPQPGDCKPSEK